MQTKLSPIIPSQLRREWGYYIITSLIIIGAIFAFLNSAQPPGYNVQWGMQTILLFFFLLIYVWRILPTNHRNDETAILPTLGPGTWLTLTRSTLIATICGFYFLPEPVGWAAWLPAILYTVAALTDFFDGWLARITNHSTLLGQRLDMDMDSLGILTITALVFQYDKIPFWYFGFGFARYIFLFGLWLRKQRKKTNAQMGTNPLRRWLAALQMGFIAVIVYPLIRPPATQFAATLFLIPFAGSFIIDWLHIIQHEKKVYFQRLQQIGGWVAQQYGVISFAMRVLIVLLTMVWLNENAFTTAPFLASIILSILILSGTLVRASAISFLILIGLTNTVENFNWVSQLLLVLNINLLVFGSGKFSLWNPEDWVVWNRAGD